MKAKVRALPRTFLCFGITDMKLCALHFGELRTCGGAAKPSLWGRWHGAVPWHCTVTDEVSPPLAGLTSVRALANSMRGAGAQRRANRGSAAVRSVLPLPRYRNNNLSWCEAPTAVEHPRDTENPPGTPSGRRLRLGTIQSPVERLFPLRGESHAGA